VSPTTPAPGTPGPTDADPPLTPAQALLRLDALLGEAAAALACGDLDALSAAARAKAPLIALLEAADPADLPRDRLAQCATRTRELSRAIAARRAQVERRLWLLARASGRAAPLYGADGRLHGALGTPHG
jgi:hypothetical protein